MLPNQPKCGCRATSTERGITCLFAILRCCCSFNSRFPGSDGCSRLVSDGCIKANASRSLSFCRDIGDLPGTGNAVLHNRCRRRNDGWKAGIENDALRPFPIRMNADDGQIGMRTVMRHIVGLGAERPTVPQRSVPLIVAATVATTTTAATATPTAIRSAQINIRIDAREERLGAAARRDLPPPRFVSHCLRTLRHPPPSRGLPIACKLMNKPSHDPEGGPHRGLANQRRPTRSTGPPRFMGVPTAPTPGVATARATGRGRSTTPALATQPAGYSTY
jgi:hypothetical protein